MNYAERLKEDALKRLQEPGWEEYFKENFSGVRTTILWILADLVQEGQFIEQALRIAEIYADDPDPAPDQDKLNEKITKGEEVRNIYTVRGTVPWLLQKIVATLKTEYYSRVLIVIEKLADDKCLYVRQQVPAALSSLTVNVRAKNNKDGTPFNFTDADKAKATRIAWKMLRNNTEYPRILETVADTFDKLRPILTADEAKLLLNTLFYDQKGELRPDYLSDHAAPYAFFFAEYRQQLEPAFPADWFRDFFRKLIKDAGADVPQAPRLKTTLIWIMWKQMEEENKVGYELFKKYIPLLFEGKFRKEAVGQLEFLVERVLGIDPAEGVQLAKQFFQYLSDGLFQPGEDRRVWLTSTLDVVEKIAQVAPDDLVDILSRLEKILYVGAYVGELPKVFESYKLVTEDKRKAIREQSDVIYARVKAHFPDLNPHQNL